MEDVEDKLARVGDWDCCSWLAKISNTLDFLLLD
jgi:hypothetical protein